MPESEVPVALLGQAEEEEGGVMPEDFRCCGMAWRGARLRCGKCGKRSRLLPAPYVRELAIKEAIQPRMNTRINGLDQPPADHPWNPGVSYAAAFRKVFSRNLRAWIARMGINRVKLSGLCGLSRPAICRYERGGHTPREEQIKRLADALGIRPVDLVSESAILEEMQMMKENPCA